MLRRSAHVTGWLLFAAIWLACAERDDTGALCAEARRTHGWCDAAGAGYVASVEIASPVLYEALDAHGHDVDPEVMGCESCRRARAGNGFCPDHRMGYVGGLAYLSPLTYQLARGEAIDPDDLDCPVCRASAAAIGWCEEHAIGYAGSTALRDRDGFEQLAAAYRVLLAAVDKSEECDLCAAAMVADGTCPVHRVTFKDGAPQARIPTPQPSAQVP